MIKVGLIGRIISGGYGKNKKNIKWVNKVHEKLEGFKTYATLPPMKDLALYHPKDIKRQEKQNAYYDTL